MNTREIQTALGLLGYDVGPIDGIWGSKSKNATRQFQADARLTVDGIPGPKTQEALSRYRGEQKPFYQGTPNKITPEQFSAMADEFGIDVASIKAVQEVEAAGSGFTGNNVKALYEPHIAYRYSGGNTRIRLGQAGLAYKSWVPGSYPKTSYERIDQCTAIAGAELAALSTSWGLGQIMGFNHEAAGYPDAVSMVEDFARGEDRQLVGMLNFIASKPAIMKALKSKNWAKFAQGYNGEGYAKHGYDKKLAAAYKRHST